MSASEQAPSQVTRLPGWLLPTLIVAALIATYVSEVIVNANKERFFTPTGLPPFPPELLRKVMWDNIYNHSICYGALGAVTCGLLTMIASGIAGPARAIAGFVVGSTLGLVSGAAVGVLGYFITSTLQPMNLESILMAMIIFAPVWSVLGIVTCGTTVFLVGRPDLLGKAVGMAFVMALFTVILYPLAVTIAFPAQWPGRIIPEFPHARLTCYGIGSICIAVAIILTFKPPKAVAAAPAEDASTDATP